MQKKPKLLEQISEKLTVLHYSNRTQQAYLKWIKEFIIYHKKTHPQELGTQHVKDYLSYLAVERKVSSSTQNQALQALLFLYKSIIKKILVGWMI